MCCTKNNQTASVTNQKECQEKCVNDSKCTGICYSYVSSWTNMCLVCKDDKMQNVGNNFGFYSRSGNVQGYAFKPGVY